MIRIFNKITCVKAVRDATGADLASARRAVEAIMEEGVLIEECDSRLGIEKYVVLPDKANWSFQSSRELAITEGKRSKEAFYLIKVEKSSKFTPPPPAPEPEWKEDPRY